MSSVSLGIISLSAWRGNRIELLERPEDMSIDFKHLQTAFSFLFLILEYFFPTESKILALSEGYITTQVG